MRSRRLLLTRWRVAVVRLATAVLALVTLFAVLRAGSNYVYCPAMQTVSNAACCAGDDEPRPHEDARVASVRRTDCCERHVLAKLPAAGALAEAPPALTAPLLALAPPPPIVLDETPAPPRQRFDYEVRAGPVTASRRRAETMVALN